MRKKTLFLIENPIHDFTPKKFLTTTIPISIACFLLLMNNTKVFLELFFGKIDQIFTGWDLVPSLVIIDGFIPNLFLMALILIFTPLFEELLFRKTIIDSLKKMGYGRSAPILISSLMFSMSHFFFNLVTYSLGYVIWTLLIALVEGVLLALVYARTHKIRFSFTLNCLFNGFLYLFYLAEFHPLVKQNNYYISVVILSIVVLGLFLLFYNIFDLIQRSSSLEELICWLNNIVDFRVIPKTELKILCFTIFIMFPLVPEGLMIFIEHTILYNDFWGILIEKIITSVMLFAVVFILSFQLSREYLIQGEEKKKFEINSKPDLKTFFSNLIAAFPRIMKRLVLHIIHNSGLILLIFGLICPFYVIVVSARANISFITIWQVITNNRITIGQSPFITYNQLITDIRSNVPFFGNRVETDQKLILFQQLGNKWNFLPDTFMANEADWLHGLMTVGVWFIILGLVVLVFKFYSRSKLKTCGLVLILTISELFWSLLALGVGSTSTGGAPSIPPMNQTSILVQFEIEIEQFSFFPIGLIVILLSLAILLFQGIKQRKKNKH